SGDIAVPGTPEEADTDAMHADELDWWREHPNPSDEEIRGLCEAWLAYHREEHDGGVDTDDPNWWAVEAAMDAESELERIWLVVRLLYELATPDDPAVGMIGCGPILSMIYQCGGDATMDLIEPVA
ncbi:MAG TPA: hypothetical protein VK701_01925, partial [Solirubrobacteraceae bacterium]|nr:hypothetical protein [Solirubrobacteraceae bacterium]